LFSLFKFNYIEFITSKGRKQTIKVALPPVIASALPVDMGIKPQPEDHGAAGCSHEQQHEPPALLAQAFGTLMARHSLAYHL
jgi:hypothetical protein